MARFNGGSSVPGGTYWNPRHWSVTPVRNDGEKLPGTPADRYLRIHFVTALLLAPLLGGLMVVFLPFIGLYLTAQAAVRPLVGMFQRSAQDLAATVTPGWAPGAAHFTGKRSEEKTAEEAPSKEAKLEELAKEIDAKRRS